jgi:plastin-1
MLRATQVIQNATAIGASVFIKPKDICDGNKKLNISLVAQLFNTCHGLLMEDIEDTRKTTITLSTSNIDDVGDSREERVFRMWINSLNIDGVYINSDLFSETQNGVYLLKLINQIVPGTVVWKRLDDSNEWMFMY